LLQYQIIQDRRIARHFGTPIDLTYETLKAHRYALQIAQENADALYNTAQVLSSLAELLGEHDDPEGRADAIRSLQEAIELFSACLTRQELEFSERQARLQEFNAASTEDQGGVSLQEQPPGTETRKSSVSNSDSTPEEWATVVEPVTANTLLDTGLAQLAALAILADMSAPSQDGALANISEIATPLIKQRIPYYISLISTVLEEPEETPRGPSLSITATSATMSAAQSRSTNPRQAAEAQAGLTIANFTSSLSEAEYRSDQISAEIYSSRLSSAYDALILTQGQEISPENTDALTAYADALLDFSTAVASNSYKSEAESATLQWQALVLAQALLGRCTKATWTTSEKKSQVYQARGDIELIRSQLAQRPSASAAVAKNATVIAKNAGVYYRGAIGYAKQHQQQMGASAEEVDEEDVLTELVVKEAVAMLLLAGVDGKGEEGLSVLRAKLQGLDRKKVEAVLEDMVEQEMLQAGMGRSLLEEDASMEG